MQALTAKQTIDVKRVSLAEYFAFRLGGREYGVAMSAVQELCGCEEIIGIANSPDYIKGVINLRGNLVLVVDLRIKYGSGSPAYDRSTAVIVLKMGKRVVGVIVDKVCDVVCLRKTRIGPALQIAGDTKADFVDGIVRLNERMLHLLNIEKLLLSEEFALLAKLSR